MIPEAQLNAMREQRDQLNWDIRQEEQRILDEADDAGEQVAGMRQAA